MRVEVVKSNVPDLPVHLSNECIAGSYMGECGLHIHDEIEILSNLSGHKLVCAGGKNIEMTAGDVVLINARVPHSTKDLEPYTVEQMLQFRIEKLRVREFEHMNRYLSALTLSEEEPVVFMGKETQSAKEITKLIELMRAEDRKKECNYEFFIRGYMDILLGTLYRNNILHDAEKTYNNDMLKKIWPVIEYIDKNYYNNITIEKLSGILNINKNYFCRLFKAAAKTTPTEYINFVRVWKAENLLTTTKDSILEISMAVGFSSVSYFNRIFKKLKKTTPTAYRSILYAKNKMI